MGLSVASCFVNGSFHGDEIGDRSGDYGRHGFRPQDTSHYYFHNNGKGVGGDGRGGYRSHSGFFPYHNPGEIGKFLGIYVHGDERILNRY